MKVQRRQYLLYEISPFLLNFGGFWRGNQTFKILPNSRVKPFVFYIENFYLSLFIGSVKNRTSIPNPHFWVKDHMAQRISILVCIHHHECMLRNYNFANKILLGSTRNLELNWRKLTNNSLCGNPWIRLH